MTERFPLAGLIDRLAEERRSQGLTITDVAKRLGEQRKRLSNYELGKREPSLEFLDRWAQALGLEMFVGITGGEPLTPEQAQAVAMAIPLIREIPADRLGMAIAQLEAAAKF